VVSASHRAVFLCMLAAGAASACSWWDSPERQIHRVLDAIAARLSHDAPVAELAAAAAATGLQEHLSADVAVEAGAPFPVLAGRDAAIAAAARLIAGTRSLRVEFVDVRATITGASADVVCNVTTAVRDRAGQETQDARELNVGMRQMEGRWVVERVKALNVLEPVS
jgi:hypothetical protein